MNEHEPWRWTLEEAIEAIAAGTITPLAVAESQLARIAATDAAIDARATLDPGLVRAQAARKPAPGAKLGGIGVGVKDIIATRDLPTAMGSPMAFGCADTASSGADAVDMLGRLG